MNACSPVPFWSVKMNYVFAYTPRITGSIHIDSVVFALVASVLFRRSNFVYVELPVLNEDVSTYTNNVSRLECLYPCLELNTVCHSNMSGLSPV